jgi:putative transposase
MAIVDHYSKKCLCLMAGFSLKGVDVREALKQVMHCEQVVPQHVQCDNGSEFISKEVDCWAYDNRVVLDFSRPGKPTDNPFVESVNGTFRDECLSVN